MMLGPFGLGYLGMEIAIQVSVVATRVQAVLGHHFGQTFGVGFSTFCTTVF
jgi:hypothetical protein